jgi:hypothetical protein
MKEGHRSNMTPDRARALTSLGLCWDYHTSNWLEKLEDLKAFKANQPAQNLLRGSNASVGLTNSFATAEHHLLRHNALRNLISLDLPGRFASPKSPIISKELTSNKIHTRLVGLLTL